MKMIGKLAYWNAQKTFGIIETKTPEGAGYRIERYFLHASQVVFQPEEIREGQLVRFVVREREPKEGHLRYAGSVEIFGTSEQAQQQGGAL